MRVRSLLGFALAAALVVAVPAGASAGAAPGRSHRVAADKGPVGWQLYRDPAAMARPRPTAQARQFSSYDRTGGNDDGFANTYSCLRQSADGCVIAERSGAGEIDSMWFTRDYGSMVNDGRILVELDGKVVLDGLLQEVVDGKLGAPFVWPLVGNGDDTAGGSVIKVPMPYRESMRVTVQNAPYFYHVDYREFADADGVTTFNPNDHAQDVVDRLRGFGVRSPWDFPGETTQAHTADVAPGGTADFGALTGSGWLTRLRVRLPQVVASPRMSSDGRAYGAGGSSTFRVAVDKANDGVRLTRRIDPVIGNQVSRLLVDGQEVTTMDSGPAVAAGSWANEIVEVPADLTRGKSSLQVTTEYVSSDLDVNEFRWDVHSKVGGDWYRTDVLDLGPGHDGEEQAHGYAIRNQSWEGARTYRYPSDPAELDRSDQVLAGARLRITFDGKSTVDAPIGEFFGSGLGEYDVRSMFSSIDASFDGWYTSWWPMPYGQGAKVEVTNDSGVPISGAVVEVSAAPDPSVAAGLASGQLGYFNATHHSGQTTPGESWNFLTARGTGVFYGVTHSMRGLIASGNRRDYLEGDERVYVDGAASPTFSGTGTEDFYESGWYFRDGTTYAMPLAGNPAYELDGDGCQYDCTGAYRLLLGEAVSFGSDLSFDIEHGPTNDEPADYSSTAYRYGTPSASFAETDSLDLADSASRSAHSYAADGETTGTLESTFEGRTSGTPSAHGVTSATGAVSFTMAVDPGNAGVRLVRLSDQDVPYQRANVFVDGKPVGEWLEPLGNQHSRWLTDTFELPAAATAGKPAVNVRIEPAAGAPAWSAATYRALSRG